MGRKAIVPYGLYRAHGFFSPCFAKETGVKDEDLELFWEALKGMFEQDHSASKGEMVCRGLYVFSHESAFGKWPAHQLFERVQVDPLNGTGTPRRFEDYRVKLEGSAPPAGVKLTCLVG